LSGVLQESQDAAKADSQHKDAVDSERQSFLLFRAGPFERLCVPLALVARLEEFPKAEIEHAGGRRVVQYRSRILPLVSLTSILREVPDESSDPPDPLQVIVFSNGERSIGVLVDQILDIVQESIAIRKPSEHKGILGSAVIGGKITDILDLQTIIEAADNCWFGKTAARSAERSTVMLAEPSAFTRGIVRTSLEMAGYNVVEAADTRQALHNLERLQVDVIAASLDLPQAGAFGLLEQMRRVPTLAGIPALGLANRADEKPPAGEYPAEFDDLQVKFDRDAMLRSLSRLSAAATRHETAPALVHEKE
jgi:two-component system chemotaxis sensor kinase CheA